MQLTVNGQSRELPDGTDLPGLLELLGLRRGSVVVELNGTALVPSEVPGATLTDGDRVELVRAVAGG